MTQDNPGASQAKSCFKMGCCGCLGLGLAFFLFLVVVGILQARAKDTPPEMEERRTEQGLPTPPPLPPAARPLEGQPTGADGIVVPNILPLEGGPLPRLEDPQVGRLEIDVSIGDFKLTPGPPGEPIRIVADYDKRFFDLTETFVEDDTGAWTYRVKYGSRGGMLGMLLRGGGDNVKSKVEIIVPRGQPLDVTGFFGLGESDIDLGGLWLRNVDLELGTGEHVIEFSEPLPQPMETFHANKGIGELRVRSLGDAGPSEVKIDQQVGDLRVDLTGGLWQGEALIDLDLGLGECRISLPEEGVRIQIDKASVGLGERRIRRSEVEELPEDAPTLTIRATGNVGEVRIE